MQADLHEAELQQANLGEANLREANLREATHLEAAQLAKAKSLYETKLDLNLLKEIREQYPHLLEKPKPDPQSREKPK
jgi:uncharacterized protein YjbI with pentapeptide repeats